MTDIQKAAAELAQRRMQCAEGPRLPEQQCPQTLDEALQVQAAVADILNANGDPIGGWKCLLPPEDKVVIGPIYQSRIFNEGAECTLSPLKHEAAIEPEFAFKFARALPAEGAPYSHDQVAQAVGSIHLAFELIKSRFKDPDECAFPELLADGLFNQGLVVGPAIATAPPARCALTLTVNGQSRRLDGRHPNEEPFAPVVWLVNFLAERGITVQAGHTVITGSYAGVIPVPFGADVSVEYEGLGVIRARFQPV